jgi:hypothetical protein
MNIGNFVGGEGDFPVQKFPAHFSSKMINVYPTPSGGVAFSPGFLRVNGGAVAEELSSGHVYIKADGTKIILCAGGGKIYKVVGAALTAIHTGLDTSAKVRFITANDACIFVNGVDAPLTYDGTTVAALGGTPPATAFAGCFHKGRLWLIERTDKLLASHSALYNNADWTTAHDAGYFDFTQILKSGDELTDVQSYMDLLVFYFKNHILVYSGNTPTDYGDFQLVQQIEGAGALTDTVCDVSVDHLFISQIGCRSLRTAIQATKGAEKLVSLNIHQRLTGEIASNPDGPLASAMFQRLGWYMVLIGGTVWCYNIAIKAWCRYISSKITGMFSDSDGSSVYFLGNGYLYQFDSGWLADDVAMQREWDAAWFRFFNNGELAYLKYLELSATPAAGITIGVGARFDLNSGSADNFQSFTTDIAVSLMDDPVPDIWDVAFFMDPDEYVPTRIPMFGGGAIGQLCFSSQDEDGPMEISSLILSYVPGGKP